MQIQSPTPHPDVNHILQILVDKLLHILCDELTAVYLQGSLAVGDFDQYSDVDFIVVTKNTLSDEAFQPVRIAYDHIWNLDNYWAKHLEGSFFSRQMIRDVANAGQAVWYFDHGAREAILSDHCNTAVVRSVLLNYGIAVYGPPAAELIDAFSVDVLRREIIKVMLDWGQYIIENPDEYNSLFYQIFIVHNYSRMLHDLQNGYPGSKRAGTNWATQQLDAQWHGLINRSWENRVAPFIAATTPADPDEYRLSLDYVRYTMEKARQVTSSIGLI